MTSYGKPRWPHRVLFGSYRQLPYRMEIQVGEPTRMTILTASGPGFFLEAVRDARPPGFRVASGDPALASAWLLNEEAAELLGRFLAAHFHRLEVRPDRMIGHCSPGADDIFPENEAFAWCLDLLHRLWQMAPAEARRSMRKSEFIA